MVGDLNEEVTVVPTVIVFLVGVKRNGNVDTFFLIISNSQTCPFSRSASILTPSFLRVDAKEALVWPPVGYEFVSCGKGGSLNSDSNSKHLIFQYPPWNKHIPPMEEENHLPSHGIPPKMPKQFRFRNHNNLPRYIEVGATAPSQDAIVTNEGLDWNPRT